MVNAKLKQMLALMESRLFMLQLSAKSIKHLYVHVLELELDIVHIYFFAGNSRLYEIGQWRGFSGSW